MPVREILRMGNPRLGQITALWRTGSVRGIIRPFPIPARRSVPWLGAA